MSRKNPPETPLYVRLPASASAKLDRAAAALGVAKKDLVAGLVTRYVDPDSSRGLSELGTLATHRPVFGDGNGPTLGSYTFQAYERQEPPEIMSAEQAARFLQIDERLVVELAEAGQLPGKRLGSVWRFSRDALVAWLSTPDR